MDRVVRVISWIGRFRVLSWIRFVWFRGSLYLQLRQPRSTKSHETNEHEITQKLTEPRNYTKKYDSAMAQSIQMNVRSVLAETNRGLLLDIVVFVTNLGLMGLMTNYFIEVIRRAGENERSAQLILLVCSLLMFVLPAAGAILKRWHFHQRQRVKAEQGQTLPPQQGRKIPTWLFDPINTKSSVAAGCSNLGCLFSWMFYFVLSIFLSAVMMSLLQSLIYGRRPMSQGLFVPLVFVSFAFCVFQTALVYRYFVPPKKSVRPFLRGEKSEQIGDLCIFINMMLFQVFWNIAIREFPTMEATSFSNFAGNLFFLTFIALLIYFPPRIFYLAEDFNRPATWITMLLANAPTIVRVVLVK